MIIDNEITSKELIIIIIIIIIINCYVDNERIFQISMNQFINVSNVNDMF